MLLFDPVSGASGDMLLGTMLQIVDKKKVESVVSKTLGQRVVFRLKGEEYRHFPAPRLVVESREKSFSSTKEMIRVVSASGLPKESKKLCFDVLKTVDMGEKSVHGEKHSLHDLGDVDTLIDVVGFVSAWQQLGYEKIVSTPLAVGDRAAPGVLEISRILKTPLLRRHADHELTTPTGAAVLANFASFADSPCFVPEKTVYCRGSADFAWPNLLRLVKTKSLQRVFVVEASVDDLSGEDAGFALERLNESCLEATVLSQLGKKNRPTFLFRALCEENELSKICEQLMFLTGSLGVRFFPVERLAAERATVEKKFSGQKVRIKVSRLGGKTLSEKPEFEDLKKLYKKTGETPRRLRKKIR